MRTPQPSLESHQLGHDSHDNRVDGCGSGGRGPAGLVAVVAVAVAGVGDGAVVAARGPASPAARVHGHAWEKK